MSEEFGPHVPNSVVFDVLDETSNRVIGAYMGALKKTDDPSKKDDLKEKIKKAWKARSEFDADDREAMIDHIHLLRRQLADLRGEKG